MQHPEERLERKMKKIAEGSSAWLLHDLEFNPADCINKPLVFNLKKIREDQIIEKIIENLSKDNDEYYIEHTKGSNMFMIKQDPNQLEKQNLFKAILIIEKKLALATVMNNNRNVKELILLRERAVNFVKELGEEFVGTN